MKLVKISKIISFTLIAMLLFANVAFAGDTVVRIVNGYNLVSTLYNGSDAYSDWAYATSEIFNNTISTIKATITVQGTSNTLSATRYNSSYANSGTIYATGTGRFIGNHEFTDVQKLGGTWNSATSQLF